MGVLERTEVGGVFGNSRRSENIETKTTVEHWTKLKDTTVKTIIEKCVKISEWSNA